LVQKLGVWYVGAAPLTCKIPDTAYSGSFKTMAVMSPVQTPPLQEKPLGHAGSHTAPHTLATPPPPHDNRPEQVPQLAVLPQPSGTVPQFLPSDVQVMGTQAPWPHTPGVPPPPHVSPDEQVPQCSVLPQPSDTVPQFFPCAAQLFTMQLLPQRWSAPHATPAAQPPQSSTVLHPSLALPHS